MSARSESILSALSHDWKTAETLVTESGLEWNSITKSVAYRALRSQVKFHLAEHTKVNYRSYWRLANEPKN